MKWRQNLEYSSWKLRTDDFFTIINNGGASKEERLRAACSFAAFAIHDERWPEIAPQIVDLIAASDLLTAPHWFDMLQGVASQLQNTLEDAFDSDDLRRRRMAANALAAYLLQDGEKGVQALHPLILKADARQHFVLTDRLLNSKLPLRSPGFKAV